ncbi:atp-dependent dna helicase protein [Rutstroemia sp. NJR-2017a WRK4]|nr:atp-dependent dna helicase protein [Rutstroemia sp. NJR-2017a WRK4]
MSSRIGRAFGYIGSEGIASIDCPGEERRARVGSYHYIRSVVGLEILFEANRKEVDKDIRMLFDSWMDITTVLRYIEVCRQLIYYIFRCKDIESEKQPGFKLTER